MGSRGQDAGGSKMRQRIARLKERGAYRYHATTLEALYGIKERGLLPNRGEYGNGVYFAETEQDAKDWTDSSTGGKTVLRVNVEYLAKNTDYDEFPGDQGWTENKIPVKAIEISTYYGWKKLSEYGLPPRRRR